MNTPYTPINCDFYDILEAASTLRQNCEIVYVADDQETIVQGRISNLYALDGEEFMLINDSLRLRLDAIVSVNGVLLHSFGTYCSARNV
jgi:Rho-binding antiterminator